HASGFLDRVDRDDVRVVQRGESPRLALEPRQPFRIGGHGFRQNLDRNLAPELRILRPVHFSHPARAEWREDLVRAEAGASGEAQGFSCGRDSTVASAPATRAPALPADFARWRGG